MSTKEEVYKHAMKQAEKHYENDLKELEDSLNKGLVSQEDYNVRCQGIEKNIKVLGNNLAVNYLRDPEFSNLDLETQVQEVINNPRPRSAKEITEEIRQNKRKELMVGSGLMKIADVYTDDGKIGVPSRHLTFGWQTMPKLQFDEAMRAVGYNPAVPEDRQKLLKELQSMSVKAQRDAFSEDWNKSGYSTAMKLLSPNTDAAGQKAIATGEGGSKGQIWGTFGTDAVRNLAMTQSLPKSDAIGGLVGAAEQAGIDAASQGATKLINKDYDFDSARTGSVFGAAATIPMTYMGIGALSGRVGRTGKDFARGFQESVAPTRTITEELENAVNALPTNAKPILRESSNPLVKQALSESSSLKQGLELAEDIGNKTGLLVEDKNLLTNLFEKVKNNPSSLTKQEAEVLAEHFPGLGRELISGGGIKVSDEVGKIVGKTGAYNKGKLAGRASLAIFGKGEPIMSGAGLNPSSLLTGDVSGVLKGVRDVKDYPWNISVYDPERENIRMKTEEALKKKLLTD